MGEAVGQGVSGAKVIYLNNIRRSAILVSYIFGVPTAPTTLLAPPSTGFRGKVLRAVHQAERDEAPEQLPQQGDAHAAEVPVDPGRALPRAERVRRDSPSEVVKEKDAS